MKKIAIAAALSGLIAAPAFAQSTVTLFGYADAAYVNQTNRVGNGAGHAVQSGAWQASRWGVRGAEDLGNGTKAIFDIASTIALDTGANANSGRMFDRNAYVGLSNTSYGTVMLGRQVTTLTEALWVTDPLRANNGATNMNVRYGYLAGPGTPIADGFGPGASLAGNSLDRQDNTVKYVYKGTSGGPIAMGYYSFGESSTAGNSASKSGGLLAGWDASNFQLRAAYAQFKNATGAAKLDAWTVGGVYTLDKVKLKATWSQNKIDGVEATYHEQEIKVGSAGVTYSFTPALDVTLAYYRGTRGFDNVSTDQKAQKFYVVPEYFLSKRTWLYAIVDYERFNATGSALSNGTPLEAGTRSSTYLATGISHAF
ncbi:porin [Derxia gummosa]|uniref:Porin n=1 Tax=Derxia gummosa DSM 723 TaxID=1121388 RepID=A0A8B6X915_9BURK|nr:porin [Derxia gummosa]